MAVIHLMQDLHGVAHVGEVGADEGAGVVRRADQVDVRDPVSVLEQFRQAYPAELAAAAGQHHFRHGRTLRSLCWTQSWIVGPALGRSIRGERIVTGVWHDEAAGTWLLAMRSTCYVFGVPDDGAALRHLHWGAELPAAALPGLPAGGRSAPSRWARHRSWALELPDEYVPW